MLLRPGQTLIFNGSQCINGLARIVLLEMHPVFSEFSSINDLTIKKSLQKSITKGSRLCVKTPLLVKPLFTWEDVNVHRKLFCFSASKYKLPLNTSIIFLHPSLSYECIVCMNFQKHNMSVLQILLPCPRSVTVYYLILLSQTSSILNLSVPVASQRRKCF